MLFKSWPINELLHSSGNQHLGGEDKKEPVFCFRKKLFERNNWS